MTACLKRYALFLSVAAAGIILYIASPARGEAAAAAALQYLIEMLLIIPPVFVLIGLLDVWVPRKIVEQRVGPGSGFNGVIISILAATAAAGPLYAGFPVAEALLKKGCRLSNAVIFLGVWATVKVPMLMMEIKFVGLSFALLRLALTLPLVILTGYVLERLIPAVNNRESGPQAHKQAESE
ncbi:MAG: permease [Bacillota bacterium]